MVATHINNMKKKEERKKDYLSSLKSIETENVIDQIFYRPIGYKIAKSLQNTGITPNAITIISIFVGISAGVFWFFPYSLSFAIIGILALIAANILDCVDGQLARLTGIKSEVGRILDGFAGDLWFLSIYIALAHRLYLIFPHLNPWLFVLVAVASGISHLNQASITDYYKTLHLFFISNDKGKEFENSQQIEQRYATMKPGINKVITWGYILYTRNQENATPRLQKLLTDVKSKYGKDIPTEIRGQLRANSLKLMPLLDTNTFNGRSIILFTAVLFNIPWLYFVWEIVVLNILKIIIKSKHEKFCTKVEI